MIQAKICGLTNVEKAVACALLGADAIGLVFYPPSPRFVEDEIASEIGGALPEGVISVGVFVDADYDSVMEKVEKCGLRMVQLHGVESPKMAADLEAQGVNVIKTFFENRQPFFNATASYKASACLVECAGDKLPGGNAKAWDWRKARGVGGAMPLVLAGGLDPENIGSAVSAAMPDAVDISSGVEASPGNKDLDKVKLFISNLRSCGVSNNQRRVFK